MTYSSSSLNFLLRLLQAATLCPPSRPSFFYKCRYVYFIANGFTMMACVVHTIFTEDTFTAIQGCTIAAGVFNSTLKLAVLGMSNKLPKIIDKAERIHAYLSKQNITSRLTRTNDKQALDHCRLFLKAIFLYFPFSIIAALYKVYFLGSDSLLIGAWSIPKVPHFTLTLALQICMIGPVWLSLSAYLASLIGLTSLIGSFVRSLIQIMDAQKLDHIDNSLFKVHIDIITIISEINRSIGPMFMVEMFLSPFQSCFCAYGTIVGLNKNSIQGFNSMILLVVSLFLPLSLSLSFQRVINEGEHLHNSLHLLKWDERSPRQRQLISILANQTARGLQFQYRKVFTFNMERFSDYLHCVMSYITLMKNLGIK